MKQLLDKLQSIGDLSSSNAKHLLSALRRHELPARSRLLDEGQVCNSIYFVEVGIARTFYYKDGKDVSYWIALENDFLGSMSSYFTREPSNKLLETVEDCVLWEFPFEKLEALFSTSAEMGKMGRLFSNYGISLMEKRFDDLHFHTAKERYELLMERHPEIILRVPLGMIASFLGITQETLSRIRSAR